jgi:cytochrome c553
MNLFIVKPFLACVMSALSFSAFAEGGPKWAYPLADVVQPTVAAVSEPRRVPNSALFYKSSEIDADPEVDAAAKWFATVKPISWIKVVETDSIPKSYFNKSRKRIALPGGATEPLGDRIAEFPEDAERVLNRDPYAGFVAYVPKGSVALGKVLALEGGGKTVACAACHGPTLRGAGDIPRIAGISPLYTVRQMFAFKTGSRKSVHAVQMLSIVANLDGNDITHLAAYLATLTP